jgi:hypothetical protein
LARRYACRGSGYSPQPHVTARCRPLAEGRPTAVKSAILPPPRIRPANFSDYEKIQELGLSFSLDIPPEEDWRKLWLDNPLRSRFGDALPIGWVLETACGAMVGTMGTVWVPYTFQGSQLVSAVSRAWFVRTEYRPFALQLMDEYLNQPNIDLFINNAVSVPALESFKRFCKPIPLGEWDCMSYWIPLEQPLPTNAAEFSIETTDRFDSRFDQFWEELLKQNPEKLLAERTSLALTWHFGAPMRKGRLWVLTASHKDKLRAYCTLTLQERAFQLPALSHDVAGKARSMRLVDYQTLEPERDLLPALLRAALERCAKANLMLENFGRGVPKMRTLDDRAPYRKKLENWKFFYSAADAGLDAELSSARFWDPSAYDGDASFE